MENRGLVTVAPDPGDGRAVLVRRTGEGERLREFTLEQITDLEDEFARIVGAERYTVFREVLDALVRG